MEFPHRDSTEGFRVKTKIRKRLAARKRRIQRRLDKTKFGSECPVISASNIEYESADRTQAIASGGIGLIHQMVKRLELDKAINRRLNLFKIYLPYAESDHVLSIAYNLLAGGTCLEHLELRRNDETWLDALGAQRIPDPTTAGDFCRRFSPLTISLLMDFSTYRNAFMNLPAQIIRTGRRIIYRMLSWNPWQEVFFRLADRLRRPLRC